MRRAAILLALASSQATAAELFRIESPTERMSFERGDVDYAFGVPHTGEEVQLVVLLIGAWTDAFDAFNRRTIREPLTFVLCGEAVPGLFMPEARESPPSFAITGLDPTRAAQLRDVVMGREGCVAATS